MAFGVSDFGCRRGCFELLGDPLLEPPDTRLPAALFHRIGTFFERGDLLANGRLRDAQLVSRQPDTLRVGRPLRMRLAARVVQGARSPSNPLLRSEQPT